MKQLHTLEIDEDFHKLCPKQTKEAREQLRANLKADGCLDAIKVWGGIVVDGMTRYQLCHEENIPFLVEQMQFADNDAARDWIIKHQLGRRNLTESQASELRGRLYQERKKPRGDSGRTEAKNQKTPGISPKRHNVALGDTAAEVAQETGVNRRTVQRDAKYVEALDSVPKPIQEAAREGKLSKKDTQQIAKQPAFVQEVIAESIKAGEEPSEAVKKATDYGKCPACAGAKWKQTESGIVCAKCNQPHGEPATETDTGRLNDQRLKTVKTVDALMRAFDDLHLLAPKPQSHSSAISSCKSLLKIAKGWQ